MIYDWSTNTFQTDTERFYPKSLTESYRKPLMFAKTLYNEEVGVLHRNSDGTTRFEGFVVYFGIFKDGTYFWTWSLQDDYKNEFKSETFVECCDDMIHFNGNPCIRVSPSGSPTLFQSPFSVEETIASMDFLTAHDKLSLIQTILEMNHAL